MNIDNSYFHIRNSIFEIYLFHFIFTFILVFSQFYLRLGIFMTIATKISLYKMHLVENSI